MRKALRRASYALRFVRWAFQHARNALHRARNALHRARNALHRARNALRRAARRRDGDATLFQAMRGERGGSGVRGSHEVLGEIARRRGEPAVTSKHDGETKPLRWLHISDFHLGSEDGYGHDIVLRALVRPLGSERRPRFPLRGGAPALSS